MTGERFFQILSNLHLSDNNQNDQDKLVKIGSMLKSLNHLFQLQYHPKREVSINDQMSGIEFIQYMPKKHL